MKQPWQDFGAHAVDYSNADAADRILRTRIFADLIRGHPRCEASAFIRVQKKKKNITEQTNINT